MNVINIHNNNIVYINVEETQLYSILRVLKDLYAGVCVEIDENLLDEKYNVKKEEILNLEKYIANIYERVQANSNNIISITKKELYILYFVFNQILKSEYIKLDFEEFNCIHDISKDKLIQIAKDINKTCTLGNNN